MSIKRKKNSISGVRLIERSCANIFFFKINSVVRRKREISHEEIITFKFQIQFYSPNSMYVTSKHTVFIHLKIELNFSMQVKVND